MAHYAILDENNVVLQVFPGPEEDGIDWEAFYSDFHKKTVKRTSINTLDNKHIAGKQPFRHNYANPGMIYDPVRDGFFDPKPFPSWIYDETVNRYMPPVPYPEDMSTIYGWNEESLQWVAGLNNGTHFCCNQ